MPSSSKLKVSGSMSALTTDMIILPSACCPELTAVLGSRSLSGFLQDIENQAGRGGMRQQAAVGVGDARFGGGGATPDVQCAAFGGHRAGILSHDLGEAVLEFHRAA